MKPSLCLASRMGLAVLVCLAFAGTASAAPIDVTCTLLQTRVPLTPVDWRCTLPKAVEYYTSTRQFPGKTDYQLRLRSLPRAAPRESQQPS
jgi:hypothetical protein